MILAANFGENLGSAKADLAAIWVDFSLIFGANLILGGVW